MRAERRVRVPPSSTFLPQFFLFLAPSFRPSALLVPRVSFRAAAAERKRW